MAGKRNGDKKKYTILYSGHKNDNLEHNFMLGDTLWIIYKILSL